MQKKTFETGSKMGVALGWGLKKNQKRKKSVIGI